MPILIVMKLNCISILEPACAFAYILQYGSIYTHNYYKIYSYSAANVIQNRRQYLIMNAFCLSVMLLFMLNQ